MADEIIDGIFDITVLEEAERRYRVYLVTGDQPTLIDTGYQHTSDTLFQELDALGIEPERLIVTHEDDDHSGAFDAVVDRYAPETWVPAGDAAEIRAAVESSPTRVYSDGDRVGPFQAVTVPGHTPGCSVLFDDEAGLAITGDALVGADLRGLPQGYLLPPPQTISDDPAMAEANLEKLVGLNFDVALVMHGSAVFDSASEKIEQFVEFPGK